MIQLYKNIRKLREERAMSQEALARLTGYNDRSSIAKIEKGLVDLQQSKIELFAKALGTTSQNLIGWEEKSDHLPILDYYHSLNDFGKREAVKRVKELTYIPQYTLTAMAAHNDHIAEEGELEKVKKDLSALKRPE